MVELRRLDLPGLIEARPAKHGDDRGFFSETWNAQAWADAGVQTTWVQDNQSLSAAVGTLRGLHLQLAPVSQDKLVRVSRGAIWDVAVDVRPASPTLGQWFGLEISAELWNQIFVPAGFAHGFVTLEADTEVIYKVSAPYDPAAERSIRFDEPELAISWPFSAERMTLSARDRAGLSLDAVMREIESRG